MYKRNWNTLTSLIFILLLVPCFFTLVSCYDKNKENNLFDEGPAAALALDEIDPGECRVYGWVATGDTILIYFKRIPLDFYF